MSVNKTIAEALNKLAKSNIEFRADVDERELRTLIDDYFGGADEVESELSEGEIEEDFDARDEVDVSSAVRPNLESSEESDGEVDDEGLVVVSEVSSILGPSGNRVPEAMCEDTDDERKRIAGFTCRCQHYQGGPCFRQFSPDFVLSRRLEMKSLTEGTVLISF